MKFTLSNWIVATSLFASMLLLGCKEEKEGKLTVKTNAVTEITTNSAKSGGSVEVTGNYTIGACGVCWSETLSPTVDDFFTTDNLGSGDYISSLRNLNPGTKYYVRAYATTSSGIIYGEELDFTTEALPIATIIVYTNEITEITTSTARSGGVATSSGGATVTKRGVCWNITTNPTINDNHTEDGQGLGSFSSILTSLNENTLYYVRAYVTTDDGTTTYGDEKSFITSSNGGGGGGTNDTIIVYTNDVTEITATSAKCGGMVAVNGDVTVAARGVCWSNESNPTIGNAHTTDGQGTGSFISNVTNLTAGTSYYIVAYATTNEGTTVYGEPKLFTTDTETPNVGLPTVTIGDITNISGSSAKCTGEVTSDGSSPVTERGFCWSTFSNPMIFHSHISCGTGVGEFDGQLTELEVGTVYHVRAYATNSEGTKYSDEEKTFTTHNVPTVTTDPITQYTQTSATYSGTVTDDGGASVTKRGFCWSTSLNPTLENSFNLTCGNGTGSFTKELRKILTPNTLYYVRAYAKNNIGIGYGENQSFTTPPIADDTYLHYGDGTYYQSWGLTNGGDDEWAIMLPTSILEPYDGTTITKIHTYIIEPGEYVLRIYTGGETEPTTTIRTLYYTITETGWRNLSLTNYEVSLNISQNLWVSLSCSYEAGHYPEGSSLGANNPNARWIHYNGTWDDVYEHNQNVDLCWLIQVFVTGNAKNGIETEYVLPSSSSAANQTLHQKTNGSSNKIPLTVPSHSKQ